MKRFARPSAFALTTALLAASPLSADEAAKVAYPEGYRDWAHVKSMVIQEGHSLYEAFGGIHHIYANAEGREGYEAGTFPDGAVLVFDLLETKRADNAITEGARKVLGVMVKDSDRFSETGGWGFEGFAAGDPERRVVKDAASECFQCHTAREEQDYVFSEWRQ